MNIIISGSNKIPYDAIFDTPNSITPYDLFRAIEGKITVYPNKINIFIGHIDNMSSTNCWYYSSDYELDPAIDVACQIKELDLDIRKQQLLIDIWNEIDKLVTSTYIKQEM